MRYFEDFAVGQTFDLGSYTVTRDEIVAFARQFDPQPFHLDEQRAAETPFGGLVASGWHTAAIFMRCYVDALLNDTASLGSPGVEQLRWLAPVRPGDTLRAGGTVLAAVPSSRTPQRGTLTMAADLHNQHDQVVFTMTARGLFGRRPEG